MKVLAVIDFNKNEGISKEQKMKLILYNGLSIVYGFIRGMIFQKCSTLQGNEKILPSINLKDLIVKTIEKKIKDNF